MAVGKVIASSGLVEVADNILDKGISKMGMQDTSLRLKGTRAIELPVAGRFSTRTSRGISLEGTFFSWRPEILKTCSKVITIRLHRLS